MCSNIALPLLLASVTHKGLCRQQGCPGLIDPLLVCLRRHCKRHQHTSPALPARINCRIIEEIRPRRASAKDDEQSPLARIALRAVCLWSEREGAAAPHSLLADRARADTGFSPSRELWAWPAAQALGVHGRKKQVCGRRVRTRRRPTAGNKRPNCDLVKLF